MSPADNRLDPEFDSIDKNTTVHEVCVWKHAPVESRCYGHCDWLDCARETVCGIELDCLDKRMHFRLVHHQIAGTCRWIKADAIHDLQACPGRRIMLGPGRQSRGRKPHGTCIRAEYASGSVSTQPATQRDSQEDSRGEYGDYW
jgi:hypothetical protein